jgi:hypothetical protein
MRTAVCALLLCIVPVSPVAAQEGGTGTLSGIVPDASKRARGIQANSECASRLFPHARHSKRASTTEKRNGLARLLWWRADKVGTGKQTNVTLRLLPTGGEMP